MTALRHLGKFLLAVALGCGGSALTANAGVSIVQLRSDNILEEVPSWYELGVLPGDVVLSNDYARFVILTSRKHNSSQHNGRCLYVAPRDGSAEVITYCPGPIRFWQKAEVARSERTVAVRFRHEEDGFQATLLYQLDVDSNSLVVTTTIENNNADQTVEMPIVDRLYATGETRIFSEREGSVSLKENREDPEMIVFKPRDQKVVVEAREKGMWTFTYEGGHGDEQEIQPVGFKIWPFKGKAEKPEEVAEGLDGAPREKRNWFRLRPRSNASVRRKLSVPDDRQHNDDEEDVMAESEPFQQSAPVMPAPQIQLTPSPAEPLAEVPTTPAPAPAPSARRRIIGRLRGEPSNPVAKETPAPIMPPQQSTASSRTSLPASLPEPGRFPTIQGAGEPFRVSGNAAGNQPAPVVSERRSAPRQNTSTPRQTPRNNAGPSLAPVSETMPDFPVIVMPDE